MRSFSWLPLLSLKAVTGDAGVALPDESLRIAFYVDAGTSKDLSSFYTTLEAAAKMTERDFSIRNFTAEDVRTKLLLESFDVAVFPGGSGNGMAKALGEDGLASVRSFVSAGGGYMGTCGGAFLGISHLYFYGEGAGSGPPTQEPWDRGHGPVQVEFTEKGLKDIALDPVQFGGNVTVMYWQGPIVKPRDFPSNVSVLSWFRTEIHSQHTSETTGEMVNTPAMTSIGYGQGRVALNSPHPELTPNLPEIYAGELAWVTKRSSPIALIV